MNKPVTLDEITSTLAPDGVLIDGSPFFVRMRTKTFGRSIV